MLRKAKFLWIFPLVLITVACSAQSTPAAIPTLSPLTVQAPTAGLAPLTTTTPTLILTVPSNDTSVPTIAPAIGNNAGSNAGNNTSNTTGNNAGLTNITATPAVQAPA